MSATNRRFYIPGVYIWVVVGEEGVLPAEKFSAANVFSPRVTYFPKGQKNLRTESLIIDANYRTTGATDGQWSCRY